MSDWKTAEWVDSAIEGYFINLKYEWVRPVEELGLPLYFDWFGAFFLTRNFHVRYWHQDSEEVAEVNPFWARLALHQGSKTWPELSQLILRPEDAVACEYCAGTGEIPKHPEAICNCGGLGWSVPQESKRPPKLSKP